MMKRPISLKTRIIRSAFLLTFVICLLFSIGIFTAFDFAEEALFEEHLEADIQTFITQYSLNPEVAQLPRTNFEVYVSMNGNLDGLPDYIANGLPDIDDIELDGKSLDLEIRHDGNVTFYFVTEETDMNKFELTLILSVLVIFIYYLYYFPGPGIHVCQQHYKTGYITGR